MKYSSCQSLLQSMVEIDTVNSAISGKPDAELDLSLHLEAQAGAMGLKAQRLPVSGAGFNLLVSHIVSDDAPWVLFGRISLPVVPIIDEVMLPESRGEYAT